MGIFRIAVCDDIAVARDAIVNAARHCSLLGGEAMDIVTFDAGREFLDAIHNGQRFDYIFMDIRMPELGGVDVVRELPSDYDSPVIFVTSYSEYWPKISGFIDSGFLTKPFNQETFDETIRAVIGRRSQIHNFRYTTSSKKQAIICRRIRYFEVRGHAVTMNTVDATIPLANAKLRDICEELQPHGFFLCNRAFLINLRYYHDRTSSDVLLNSRNGIDKIPLSREKAAELDEIYILYKTRGEYAF
jgi:DNA-binding LytR/AlgR family response regulator